MARILGIDIDGESLRAAVVRTALRRVELERVMEIPLAQAPGTPGRRVELTEAVRGLLGSLEGPPDAVMASLPGEVASLRTVALPASAGKRIAEILPFELETLLPFEPKDAVIDHQSVDAREGQLRVLTAAVPHERVRLALAELADLGLDPRELAVGAAAFDALPVLVPDLATGGPTLIVEFALEHTDLCLIENGRCSLARTISLGVRALPRAAEELAREIQRTLAGHRASGGAPPTRAVLCGVGADASTAAPWFARAVGCPTERAALPRPPGSETEPGPRFGRAVALAARGAHGARRINLRKGEFAASRGAMRLADHIQLAAACVVVVVMSATFSLKAQQSLLVDERTALRAQLSGITTEVFGSPSTGPAEVATLVQSREAADPLPRFDAFDALAAISAAVPEHVTHEIRRLRIDLADEKREGTVELQGTINSIQDRDAIIAELAKHECIKDIEPGRVTPAGTQYNYQIEATLRCPGDEPAQKSKRRGGEP
jgi:general secretion pathway protein L